MTAQLCCGFLGLKVPPPILLLYDISSLCSYLEYFAIRHIFWEGNAVVDWFPSQWEDLQFSSASRLLSALSLIIYLDALGVLHPRGLWYLEIFLILVLLYYFFLLFVSFYSLVIQPIKKEGCDDDSSMGLDALIFEGHGMLYYLKPSSLSCIK